MKKILMVSLLMASLFTVANVMAQENGNRDAQNKIVRGPYETNRFFDNIFLGVAGGINIYNGEHDTYGKFKNRIAPALDLNIGKWITPSVGIRLGYSGLQAKGWTNGQTLYAKGADGDMFKEKFGLAYLHGDFMWNFSNAVSGYKETRTWNFVPFVGAGWAHSYGNDSSDNEFAMSVGLLNNIRLGGLVDLTLEVRHMFVNQRFDGVVADAKAEGMNSATIGLTFKLNRNNFKRVAAAAAPDYTPYLNRIKDLEGANKGLNDKNQTLADENEALRNRKPEVDTVTMNKNTIKASPVALFFALGKATLDKKELANLDFYVNNAVKLDKNKTFTLTGMADSKTGSKAFNQKLSESRMQYVYDLMVNKYGIDSSRLNKKAAGASDRFEDPELNRAVVVE